MKYLATLTFLSLPTGVGAANVPTPDMWPVVVNCTFDGHTIAGLKAGVLFIRENKNPAPNVPGVLYRNGLNLSAAMDVTVDYTRDPGFGKLYVIANGVSGLCTTHRQ